MEIAPDERPFSRPASCLVVPPSLAATRLADPVPVWPAVGQRSARSVAKGANLTQVIMGPKIQWPQGLISSPKSVKDTLGIEILIYFRKYYKIPL
jgi:hypothetical protein